MLNSVQLSLGVYKPSPEGFNAKIFIAANLYGLYQRLTRLSDNSEFLVMEFSDGDQKLPLSFLRDFKFPDTQPKPIPFGVAINSTNFMDDLNESPGLWLHILHMMRHYVQYAGLISREQWIFWPHLDARIEFAGSFSHELNNRVKEFNPLCCHNVAASVDAFAAAMVGVSSLAELSMNGSTGVEIVCKLSRILLTTGHQVGSWSDSIITLTHD